MPGREEGRMKSCRAFGGLLLVVGVVGIAGPVAKVRALAVQADGRVVDFLKQPRIPFVARGDEYRARLREPVLLAREVEMRPPVHEGVAGFRPDPAHALEAPLGRTENLTRIAAELLQETVQGDGADIGQVIQDHERLPLGQGI